MEKDSLLILFSSLNWLIGGLIIYYILTVVKVHLFRYLPMRLFNYQGTLNRPFQNYYKALLQDSIAKLEIYSSSFRYIFKYKESEWMQPEIKQVKIVLNILDGFTTFLKPYIVLSILWTFFKLWFETHFFYKELLITLFEIQQFNSSLSQYSLLTFLADNTAYVVLFYSTICIMIPFLYLRREITNRIKNYFSLLLICLSIITNLSFFGSKAGDSILSQQKQIKDIEFKIAETHNEIYKIAATEIIINDFDKEIEEYQNAFNDEQEVFEKQNIDSSKIILSDSYRSELINLLNRLTENLNSKYSIPSPPNISTNNEYKNPKEDFYKSSTEYFYNENFRQTASSKVKTDDGYFTSKKNWNYEHGQRILSELKKSYKVTNEESIPKKRIISWIEACFEFGIDKSLEACIDYFGAENQLVIKEFLVIVLSENYKEPLASRIAIYLSSISNEIGQKLSIPKTRFTIPKLFTKTIIADDFNKSKDKFNSGKREIIKRQEDEISAKIKEEKLFAEQQAKIKIQQEKEYRAEQRLIKENEALSKKIVQRLNKIKFNPDLNQYTIVENSSDIDASIKSSIISLMTDQGNKSNYEYNIELKSNYEYLKNNGNSKTILNGLFNGVIKPTLSGSIGICPICHLPLSFPICLRRL